ncbi:MAG: Flagellar sensor histidine kinase FleS [Myxococcaceae bacterium]|nr:Flagellar sensor histidine kinase FleS [Myxococcaceae bacterium]
MPLPAALSSLVAAVALLSGILALGLSRGPGWREFRWFGFAALAAAAYAAAQIPVTLDVEPSLLVLLQRVGIAFAAMHGAARVGYLAASERRATSTVERAIIAVGIAFAAIALIPGVVFRPQVATHVWHGFTYRDPEATWVGDVCFFYFVFATFWIVSRHIRSARQGDTNARWHAAGLLALAVAAANDTLVGMQLVHGPYLLDLGFFAVVVTAGVTITKRVVAEAHALQASSADLARAQTELVERERLAALGELAAVVAHEVRNPVAVIFNALVTLKSPLVRETSTDASLLRIIGEEASRLNRMVTVLLDFARPQPLEVRLVALDDIVRAALEAAAVGRDPSDVVLDTGEGDCHIACDEQLVHQALVNLVGNALAAPARRSPVRVEVAPGDTGVAIRVIDDGVGVPPEQAARLFTPFFTTRPTGTGLGLAVVARIARAHGGTASHEPTTGGGATFVVWLPRGRASASAPDKAE